MHYLTTLMLFTFIFIFIWFIEMHGDNSVKFTLSVLRRLFDRLYKVGLKSVSHFISLSIKARHHCVCSIGVDSGESQCGRQRTCALSTLLRSFRVATHSNCLNWKKSAPCYAHCTVSWNRVALETPHQEYRYYVNKNRAPRAQFTRCNIDLRHLTRKKFM